MKQLIFASLFSLLLFSCSDNSHIIPEGILPQEEMTSILTEIHLAQAGSSDQTMLDSSKFSLNDYVASILSHHKIKKEDFIKSMKFYSGNPELLNEVYDSVIINLNKLQSGINN
jgi:hypothetical protein